jgi:hypothetical protein
MADPINHALDKGLMERINFMELRIWGEESDCHFAFLFCCFFLRVFWTKVAQQQRTYLFGS